MSVEWTPEALVARTRLMEYLLPLNPLAAAKQDGELHLAGGRLDGVALFSPLYPDNTYRAVACSGRFVLVYERTDDHVKILAVLPTKTNWKELVRI